MLKYHIYFDIAHKAASIIKELKNDNINLIGWYSSDAFLDIRSKLVFQFVGSKQKQGNFEVSLFLRPKWHYILQVCG